jgi:hypothetical protein
MMGWRPGLMRWWRVVLAGCLPMLVGLWLGIPTLQPKPVEVRGAVEPVALCLGLCAQGLAIGGQRLVCKADLLGVPYDCRERLFVGGEATARYVALPSLARLLGQAPATGVLTRLEHNGQVLFARSARQHVWQAIYGGWVFHAIYWPIVGLIIWRWPGSRISRRVQGQT